MAVLNVVSPDELTRREADEASARVEIEDRAAIADQEQIANSLVGFIDNQFSTFVRHRDGGYGWSDRLQQAMRTFKGEYDGQKLAQIREFGGSEIYARLCATKCRGATSLLRDVYLNTEKPWNFAATPDPTLPEDMLQTVQQLVEVEVKTMTMAGQTPDPNQIRDRIANLMGSLKKAAIKKAREEAGKAFDKVDDILVEGGFYESLSQFLIDLPLFPFACIKGPVVRVVPEVTWVNGKAQIHNKPKMFWYRVSPFDLWWTPGVSDIADAAVIERTRITRHEINQMIGLPGYNQEAIREVLKWYGTGGYVETNATTGDNSRAQMESREDPRMNTSGMIDMLEYHGYVQGKLLRQYGFKEDQVPDEDLDYFVDAFKIGRYIIKVQLSPSVRKRAPYYITSFEKVPGTVVGNALPDILVDVQDAANAALRSLINNMAMASGPQVVVHDDRIADNENGDELYPWKRWHVTNDPLSSEGSHKPIDFFQPESRAQELLVVYEKFTQIADELSAIPRYITGSDRTGGAGRTASGLAMLMGNSAKILQTVASNIDREVIKPAVSELYDLIMLTDQTGMLRGDESIEVLGVQVAVQRETQRQRQLELLQISANPIDSQIMGVRGRATLLRAVSEGVGLDGDNIVPPDEEIQAQMGAGPGGPPPGGGPAGQQPGAPSAPQGPQTNVVGPTPGANAARSPNPAQGPA